MARLVTIRRSLLANLSLMIVGLCAAILAITLYTGRQIVEGTSGRLTERALTRATSELHGFFEPVERNLHVAQRWARNGVLDPDDDDALNALFQPLLEANPEISSVNLGDEQGRGWMLLRLGDGWLNRRVDPLRFGNRVFYREWGRKVEAREWFVDDPAAEERYDPRERDWYRTALEGAALVEPGVKRPREVYWTEPYEFFTTQEPGLTATAHARTADGRALVLALDVLLRDVSDFTRQIEVTPNGFVGVLSRDRRFLGLPSHPGLQTPEARAEALLRRPVDLGIPVFDDAIAARQRLGLPAEPLPGHDDLFAFESGGQRWWADAAGFSVPPQRTFLVVVVIPEEDLLGPVRQLRTGVVGATALALLAAVASALLLARRYARPLAALAESSTRIRRLDLRPREAVSSRIAEVAQLAGAQESMRTTLDAFSRYVPTDVVRELVELGEAARIGGELKNLTVLFTDVQGFTSIAEHKTPEELTQHLAVYFEAMLDEIDETGTVDKLVGDGIMAFWGAPYPDPHHARHAVEAVLACQARLAALNQDWLRGGEPALPTRFGLATGPALVGNVGAPRRLSYTAVGDVVNLASRLEGLNRLYGTQVLAADPLPRLAGREFAWRAVDRVRVVGREQAVEIHELLGRAADVEPERLSFARRYEEALAHYRAASAEAALAVLAGLPEAQRRDPSVARLREACARLQEAPPAPGSGWQPVTVLDQK